VIAFIVDRRFLLDIAIKNIYKPKLVGGIYDGSSLMAE